ncbi:Uncharacterised protein [Metamycoplasma cloacale]|uniref:Uncharacterized protein n=1 Tax=Metamycoplasma cloacale TaxID=92401 RepID=A0A2Z4LMD4_9BACT|nr:hypothetical protein [Metamycoplasma cloacale]AWX42880.1 hypothetical protein DK849_02315 [Metamycoplasma cloacale]VEU79296.1 Uncharacterised protein [Metamycoplasma cloacale]
MFKDIYNKTLSIYETTLNHKAKFKVLYKIYQYLGATLLFAIFLYLTIVISIGPGSIFNNKEQIFNRVEFYLFLVTSFIVVIISIIVLTKHILYGLFLKYKYCNFFKFAKYFKSYLFLNFDIQKFKDLKYILTNFNEEKINNRSLLKFLSYFNNINHYEFKQLFYEFINLNANKKINKYNIFIFLIDKYNKNNDFTLLKHFILMNDLNSLWIKLKDKEIIKKFSLIFQKEIDKQYIENNYIVWSLIRFIKPYINIKKYKDCYWDSKMFSIFNYLLFIHNVFLPLVVGIGEMVDEKKWYLATKTSELKGIFEATNKASWLQFDFIKEQKAFYTFLLLKILLIIGIILTTLFFIAILTIFIKRKIWTKKGIVLNILAFILSSVVIYSQIILTEANYFSDNKDILFEIVIVIFSLNLIYLEVIQVNMYLYNIEQISKKYFKVKEII